MILGYFRGRRAQARALRRMVEAGFLDTCYAEAVVNEPLEISSGYQDGNEVPCRAPYFVDEVWFRQYLCLGKAIVGVTCSTLLSMYV